MTIKPAFDSTNSSARNNVPVSVITTCYGRNRHLYNQLSTLASGRVKPEQVIIVNDDANSDKLSEFDLNILQIPTYQSDGDQTQDISNTGFDIGRNRNLGASHAKYDALMFLDVDCIASYDYMASLYKYMQGHKESLLMGQPRYLQRPLTDLESDNLKKLDQAEAWLTEISEFNPWRHNLTQTDIKKTEDYGGFWSLCFAIHKAQFADIGGFDTQYVGYGAEDTDFGFSARKLGIDFYLTGAVAYHQQHGVYRPPLNHLSSIIINANIFYKKWQHWAMSGWLQTFANMGLIDWKAQQTTPIIQLRAVTQKELEEAHYPDAAYV